ncbi:2-amino-4-hydroxy-6-hydroxymethyldihydropteridine diphosphokinase [Roseomonas nepalensis]|uniref:2-amino-4-hydroxy-6-hydroxymethyldihydropteridine pyrophosphokinase n=1 Tax=Muricoccus nepalensis TaxID=1854500 RepID=A0A502GFV1_9PROT|nr:2-amino-4-hydroxy-6-hydroxymethyldihydropteridine diphosphokinase [Roseomonas nepalensis]TPG61187.1 2-amino-4-hydroxy-6-hydroxymethyldihydropteridine diphosphokinase [Roseomonas nepalensis]
MPEGGGDILVAIGANLPGTDGAAPLATCRRAAGTLDGLLGLSLVAVSRWWETAPEPPDPASPWYVNGVARLRGEADPAALLAALQAIEAAAGRVRPYPNAPRTLDLDIVAIGRLLRTAPDPVLPHPRAHLRRFVLEPLREVFPGWTDPASGRSVTEMLLALPDAPMRPAG